MALLFTIDDVKAVRRISTTFESERFAAFGQEAEEVHLRLFLGDALFLDLKNNPTDAKYATLLDGEDYQLNGELVKFFGLKKFLAYAWLFINAVEGDDFQSNVGTIGFNQERLVYPKSKSHTLKKYQDSMNIYRNNAVDYLNENSATYSLWMGNDKRKRGSAIVIPM